MRDRSWPLAVDWHRGREDGSCGWKQLEAVLICEMMLRAEIATALVRNETGASWTALLKVSYKMMEHV